MYIYIIYIYILYIYIYICTYIYILHIYIYISQQVRKAHDNKNSVFKHGRFLTSFKVLRNQSCLNIEFSLSSTFLTCSYT